MHKRLFPSSPRVLGQVLRLVKSPLLFSTWIHGWFVVLHPSWVGLMGIPHNYMILIGAECKPRLVMLLSSIGRIISYMTCAGYLRLKNFKNIPSIFQQNCPLKSCHLVHQLPWHCLTCHWFWNIHPQGCCSNPHISSSYYSPKWWSCGHQPNLGHVMDHHQFDSLFAIQYCGGYVGHTTPNTATYSDVPFGSQIHQLSFQIGLVKSSTYY